MSIRIRAGYTSAWCQNHCFCSRWTLH